MRNAKALTLLELLVVISAAVKGVPGELLEAARIDGANEIQVFFRVMIPYIQGTIITAAQQEDTSGEQNEHHNLVHFACLLAC